jgi:hypothetical protein
MAIINSSDTTGMWHEDDPVEVPFPLPGSDLDNRSSWPWLPGTILEVCGPNEWQVCVEVRELAILEDGQQPRPNTPDHELFYPVCFRDSTEIRSPTATNERTGVPR